MQKTQKKSVNREYKDRLFKLIFREKKDLLELYNAINDTDYDNPEDIEVNTLEDVVYMGMKNDVSFLITDVLNLYDKLGNAQQMLVSNIILEISRSNGRAK